MRERRERGKGESVRSSIDARTTESERRSAVLSQERKEREV